MNLYDVVLDGKHFLIGGEAMTPLEARAATTKATGLNDGNFEAIYKLEDLMIQGGSPYPEPEVIMRTQKEVEAQISLQLANGMIQTLTSSLAAKEVENDELKAERDTLADENERLKAEAPPPSAQEKRTT